jgi:LysR family cyn operon transcriptional activator
MELRHLKYFVKIAETLNFSEAAKSLFITQSTLSQQIRQLEQEVNAQLFERNNHNVRLTEAGEELLPYARQTLKASQACLDRIQDLQQMLTGTLNIGVTFSFSPILTEALFAFIKLYPKVKLNIFYKPMAELMKMLEHDEVDFALTFRPAELNKEIESHFLFDNHLAVIVREDHPLANKESVSIAELEHYDLVLPAKGLQARNAFDIICEGGNHHLKARMELNDVNILLKLVKQSGMITILSETTIYNEEGFCSIPIDLRIREMEGCVHIKKNVYQKRSAKEFIRLLRESNVVRERMQECMK